jgi:hypothetical protein
MALESSYFADLAERAGRYGLVAEEVRGLWGIPDVLVAWSEGTDLQAIAFEMKIRNWRARYAKPIGIVHSRNARTW